MEPHRIGKITEYRRGVLFLSITEWEDGHVETELHRCEPELLFYSCDVKEQQYAKAYLEELAEQRAKLLKGGKNDE